jgi:hypothetical protein
MKNQFSYILIVRRTSNPNDSFERPKKPRGDPRKNSKTPENMQNIPKNRMIPLMVSWA